jgi:DNA helicase-2/ATP-dependent DNA helicase PcrA
VSSKTGDLDSRQAEAVADRSSSLVVTGPAGSGRTTALTARFAALVDQGVDPERILVITLDDAGADRLRSTIESRLERPWEELSVLGTTGLAMRILRDAAAGADIAPDPSLLGRADRLALLADALDRLTIEAHDLGRDPLVLLASLIQRIDRLEEESIDNAAFSSWARKLPKSTPDEIAFARREAEFAAVWAEHDRILTERSARSGSGALRDAVALLERNPALQRAIATSFEELIVDGAEDFDHLAWRCVQMLRPPKGRLVLFSDPAQGFKRIRGAFGDRASATAAAGATVIELDGVHRGHSEIEFWQATTERAQAQAVASEIERLVMRDGVDPGQIAVIVSSVVREGSTQQGEQPTGLLPAGRDPRSAGLASPAYRPCRCSCGDQGNGSGPDWPRLGRHRTLLDHRPQAPPGHGLRSGRRDRVATDTPGGA